MSFFDNHYEWFSFLNKGSNQVFLDEIDFQGNAITNEIAIFKL